MDTVQQVAIFITPNHVTAIAAALLGANTETIFGSFIVGKNAENS